MNVFNKKNSNSIFRKMICIFLGIHFLLLMYIAGIYKSEALIYIELTMQTIAKPFTRSILRPRLRPKSRKILNDEKLNFKKNYIPNINIDVNKHVTLNTVTESIGMPDMSESTGLNMSDFNPNQTWNFATSKDYFEMLKIKKENSKIYPETARVKQIEDRVSVQFVITPDGQISSLQIIKSARFKSLDQAAVNAVNNSAPFPSPPSGLFKGPLRLEITLLFKLT